MFRLRSRHGPDPISPGHSLVGYSLSSFFSFYFLLFIKIITFSFSPPPHFAILSRWYVYVAGALFGLIDLTFAFHCTIAAAVALRRLT